ncbi:NADH-ubiquinone oxidoreductase-F iron-sulfur binding region domain-containing protein [Haloarchaeobius sp. TZWSO28]|uniref:NADH-ubiquinone oxidoreductase-F iron-sulfur binding region domain-containing protein n=1 Tax=Haloarchaeobius sp. TZWSO28 TaxID=3446119 RepID=UPI003EBD57FC
MTHSPGVVGEATALRIAASLTDSQRSTLLGAASETAQSVPVVATGPTGIEGIEPLVLATLDGRTAVFTAGTGPVVREAVALLDEGTLPVDGSDFVVDHGETPETLPLPADGPLAVGRRELLGPCGWVDPVAPHDYEFVSTNQDAGDVLDIGLLGRGRGDATADAPVAAAWEQAREADGDPVIVVNAHEADNRPRADRTLLESTPLAVLDGAVAVARYVDASDLVVYLTEADEHLRTRLHEALDASADDLSIVPEVVVGPDEYRAGAPTTALEAMEGADRLEPRLQPPPPSEYGLHGRPTVIHTPRTVAQVRRALLEPTAFDPDAADPGSRLVTVCGDVAAPATVELPPGGSLETVRDAVEPTAGFGFACVGGVLGGFTRDLSVAPTSQALASASLGTDGVVEFLAEATCVVATAGDRARFAAEENSGRCVPGREGTTQLTDLLRGVYDGRFDPETIRELGRVMRRSANCQIGRQAPRPAITAMDEFGAAFRAHAEGRCPAGSCTFRQ